MNIVGTGRVELPSLLPSLFRLGRGFTDKLSARMSPTNRARFLLFILLFQLPDAVLTTLPLLASHSHQVIVCVNRSFQTFSNTSMRRNFPRPYTTTYLRVVVVGQLVAHTDSEITLSRLAVLTG